MFIQVFYKKMSQFLNLDKNTPIIRIGLLEILADAFGTKGK